MNSENTDNKNPVPNQPANPSPAPAAPLSLNPVSAPVAPAAQNIPPQPAQESSLPVLDGAVDRRTFIKWTAIGWGAFAAAAAGYGTMFMRFMFPNVLFEPKQSFKAGFPDEYAIGDVSERFKDKHSVWIVRDEEKIYALSTACTHLGCTPNWLANDNKFKCPCHGSGFYRTGINFEGPAPRPLERFKVVLADDGQIVVDKTKKFQFEKGEWKDPESYLAV